MDFRVSKIKNFAVGCAAVMLALVTGEAFGLPATKDYGSLPQTQMVAISPNGALVAFRKVTDAVDQVIVVSLADRKPIFAADVSRIKPQDIYFFSNEQVYLSVSEFTRMSGFRGKFDLSTAYALDIKERKIRQLLIPGEVVYPGQSGLGHVVGLSPDGAYAFMPAYVGNALSGDKPKYSLLKVNLNQKLPPRLAVAGDYDSRDFFVDAQGEPIAMVSYHEKKNLQRVFKYVNNDWVEIFSEETLVPNKYFVGVTPDFKSLVMLASDQKTKRSTYFTMSLADGKIQGPLYGREDADIEGTVKTMQRVVIGLQYSGFYPSYKFFDEKLDKRFREIVSKFPEHSVWLSDQSPDGKNLVVKVEGSSYAGDYYLCVDGQEPLFLTASRPNIKAEDINPIGKISYAARDKLKIPTLLTIPKASVAAMKNLPAVILPHGGPARHDTIGFDFLAQALASNGYLVIQPQFRGSDGFGWPHESAGRGQWGKAMQNDLTDAVGFFVAKGMIDPKRVCIVGGSYGGYAALAGGAFTPELYKCVVSINGIGDLNDMLSFDKGQNGSDSWVVTYMENQFADGKVDKKELEKISPENFAEKFTAPVLLVHSQNDKRVPVRQSEHMKSALERAKKVVQFVRLDGDDHYLSNQDTRQKALEAVIQFVNANNPK